MRRLRLPISKVERWLMKKMIRRGFLLGSSAAKCEDGCLLSESRQK
jgi:hypothetical protein